MSHKSRNLRRKIQKEWQARKMIREHKSFEWIALNIRIVFPEHKSLFGVKQL
jgi:hypothetical protein